MSYMFSGCSSLKILNLSNFTFNYVLNMDHMFYNCSSLEELNIPNFTPQNIDAECSVFSMFDGCTSLKKQPKLKKKKSKKKVVKINRCPVH